MNKDYKDHSQDDRSTSKPSGYRHVLVIGSQCTNLQKLKCLPEVAEEFYEVMTDAQLGGCVSALGEKAGKLIDPTIKDVESAVIEAFQLASEKCALLFICYVGHGLAIDKERFYLLPTDANPNKPRTPGGSVDIIELINGMWTSHDKLRGLVLLLDACQSGVGAVALTKEDRPAFPRSYEVWTSTNAESAFDGCFTSAIVDCIKNGQESEIREHLYCIKLQEEVKKRIFPQDSEYFSRRWISDFKLARNVLRSMDPTVGKPLRTHLEELANFYIPIPQFHEILAEARRARCVAVIGGPGQGKSALVGAISEVGIKKGFAHAVAFVTLSPRLEDMADTIMQQLCMQFKGYVDAYNEFYYLHQNNWKGLDAFMQLVDGPLSFLEGRPQVRLAIDGLNHLEQHSLDVLSKYLRRLATQQETEHVHILVTSRSEKAVPEGSTIFHLTPPSKETIKLYLQRRNLNADEVAQIGDYTEGDWLMTKVLADVMTDDKITDIIPTLHGLYNHILATAVDHEFSAYRDLKPLLTVLAAAGIGPILPLPLLCLATGLLDGPYTISAITHLLASLGKVITRGQPGTAEEHVGLYDWTFAEYLVNTPSQWKIELLAGHYAIATALVRLAPMKDHDSSDSLHRYAASAEVHHLWAIGDYTQLLQSLTARSSAVPAENVDNWKNWHDRLTTSFGPDHPAVLTTRSNIARWTGEGGNPQEALRLYMALLLDQTRILGAEHADVFMTRSNIEKWTAKTGQDGRL